MDKRAYEVRHLNMEENTKKHTLHQPQINLNAYPGKRMGLTPEEVVDYIRRQKRCLGKSFALTTGSNKDLDINLPGTAYLLLGWAIEETEGLGISLGDVSVRLNNEIMVDSVFWEFFGKDFTDEEYYFIPRPLSGNDVFTFKIENVSAVWTAKIIFYYL